MMTYSTRWEFNNLKNSFKSSFIGLPPSAEHVDMKVEPFLRRHSGHRLAIDFVCLSRIIDHSIVHPSRRAAMQVVYARSG
jgi:hypothetical protein